jgi:predicted metalloprotease with PDZ domain
LDGLRRGGYKLIYSDTPSDTLKASEAQRKHVNLFFSIGVDIDDKDKEGAVADVIWGSPAFKAKLTAGAQILAVDGVAYSADVLKDAIRAARDRKAPIELIIKTGDQFTVTSLDYHDGLRYPHLERDASQPPRLDDIMTARP